MSRFLLRNRIEWHRSLTWISTAQGGDAHGKCSARSGKRFSLGTVKIGTESKFLVAALRLANWSSSCGPPHLERAVWINWCYSPPPLTPSFITTISYTPVHAQIKFQGCSLEWCWRNCIGPCQDSQSFWRLSYILMWRHCAQCGFIRIKNVRYWCNAQ